MTVKIIQRNPPKKVEEREGRQTERWKDRKNEKEKERRKV